MGIETFPVVEGYEVETFLAGEWKTLTDCLDDKMDAIARELDLTPLARFCSYSRQDAIESLSEEEVEEEEAEAELKDGVYHKEGYELWSLERRWFEPDEARRTTEELIQFLRLHPERLGEAAEDAEYFIAILETLHEVLSQAKARNKRFYLKTCV